MRGRTTGRGWRDRPGGLVNRLRARRLHPQDDVFVVLRGDLVADLEGVEAFDLLRNVDDFGVAVRFFQVNLAAVLLNRFDGAGDGLLRPGQRLCLSGEADAQRERSRVTYEKGLVHGSLHWRT